MNTVWKGSAFQCPAAANQLSLFQKSAGVLNPTAGGQCGSLSAVTTNISNDGTCYTSVLTIPAVQAMNGTTVMCADGVSLAVVGSDTVNVKIVGEDFIMLYIIYTGNNWEEMCSRHMLPDLWLGATRRCLHVLMAAITCISLITGTPNVE